MAVLKAIIDWLAASEREAIRENRCPYCGKRFKNRAGLYAHLVVHQSRRGWSRNCKPRFTALVSDILECYRHVKTRIHAGGSPGIRFTGRYVYYGSTEELARIVPVLCSEVLGRGERGPENGG